MWKTADTQKKDAKRRSVILYIVLALVLLAVAAAFVIDTLQYDSGVVRGIKVKAEEDGLWVKMVFILPSGGFSARDVSGDEGEYIGDGLKDYDGSLGQYRIMITFGDMVPHDSLKKDLSEDGVFELNDTPIPLKAKFAYPSDHGFVLYIGSDVPIHTDATECDELRGLWGTVAIPVSVGGRE